MHSCVDDDRRLNLPVAFLRRKKRFSVLFLFLQLQFYLRTPDHNIIYPC